MLESYISVKLFINYTPSEGRKGWQEVITVEKVFLILKGLVFELYMHLIFTIMQKFR